MNKTTTMRKAEIEVLQARLGARLAAALGEQTRRMPHDTSERLRVGREHALTRARQARAAAGASLVVATAGGAALLAAPPPWWLRVANVTPLVILVAGFVLIQHWKSNEQTMAAAEIDTRLLSDRLPPAAYADPGFVQFLKEPPL